MKALLLTLVLTVSCGDQSDNSNKETTTTTTTTTNPAVPDPRQSTGERPQESKIPSNISSDPVREPIVAEAVKYEPIVTTPFSFHRAFDCFRRMERLGEEFRLDECTGYQQVAINSGCVINDQPHSLILVAKVGPSYAEEEWLVLVRKDSEHSTSTDEMTVVDLLDMQQTPRPTFNPICQGGTNWIKNVELNPFQ